MSPPSNVADFHFLRTTDDYVKYGLMSLGIGIWLLLTGVMGLFDVSLRGGNLIGPQLKSTPLRVACVVISMGFFTAAILMFRHLMASIHNP
jgi:hypothetical protein